MRLFMIGVALLVVAMVVRLSYLLWRCGMGICVHNDYYVDQYAHELFTPGLLFAGFIALVVICQIVYAGYITYLRLPRGT